MKIAVTYDNGEIFQHFGKTEFFKVYEVEDNKVVSSEVIGSNGTGHGALAGLLAEQGVNAVSYTHLLPPWKHPLCSAPVSRYPVSHRTHYSPRQKSPALPLYF